MYQQKKIPADQFSVVITNPENRLNTMCVNIYEDGKFNMNGKLSEKLAGSKMYIAFTPDARHFLMKKSDEPGAIAFPKSGSKKIEQVAKHLTDQKILFPAKFNVWYDEEEDTWRGNLSVNPILPLSGQARGSKKK